MPIEFLCPSCRKQLRCPDSAAGKKARCPACGTIVTITPGGGRPDGSQAEAKVPVPPMLNSGPPTLPKAEAGGASPFAGPQTPAGAVPPLGTPTAGEGQAGSLNTPTAYPTQPANPYAAPHTTPAAPKASEGTGSEGMAIASFVLGLFGLLAWLCPIIGYAVGGCALGFGIKGRNSNQSTLAIIGIILGSITLFLSLVNSILGVILTVQGGGF